METTLSSRIKHAWNVFTNRDPTDYSYGTSRRPDRPRFTGGNEKSIVTAVYNKIAIDCSQINIKHCRLDNDDMYVETIKSTINECLTTEANLDQTGRAFVQDMVMSLLDEGCIAIVPTHTDKKTGEILELRVGKIKEWKPYRVKVEVYNEDTGKKQDVWCNKRDIGIVENPLYAVINENNSTAKRLARKLSLLDVADEKTASGKLDMIIQLPYSVRTQVKRDQVNERMRDIEEQLTHSKYGIAYADSSEKITQLNRSLDNNLQTQVEYLTTLLFSQLGVTQSILDGTADEQTMLNYYNRTIEPIISSIVDEMRRKFLTKTARTQGQTIAAFRDPFKLVPINNIAEIADKFTRNEILTSNEVRQIIGRKPSSDPKADELINSNISQSNEEIDRYGLGDEQDENSDAESYDEYE